MSAKPLPRPPKVTVACLFIGLTCAFMLLEFVSALSQWGSIELQEQVADGLDAVPGGSEISVDTALGWLRLLVNALAVMAAAGIVLAVYAARGHQVSRVLLTVLAALLALVFVGSGLLGLLPAAFALGCAFYLWSAEARAWYDARNGRAPAPAAPPRPDPFATGSAPAAPAEPMAPATPAASPSSTPPAPAAPVPSPWTSPAPARAAKPSSVLAAGIVMIVAGSLVALVCGINALYYAVAPDDYVRLLTEQPFAADAVDQLGTDPAGFARTSAVVCGVLAGLSLPAVVVGGLLLGRVAGARRPAVALSALTLPLTVVAFPLGLPWTVAAGLVVWWLTRPDVKAWFASR